MMTFTMIQIYLNNQLQSKVVSSDVPTSASLSPMTSIRCRFFSNSSSQVMYPGLPVLRLFSSLQERRQSRCRGTYPLLWQHWGSDSHAWGPASGFKGPL